MAKERLSNTWIKNKKPSDKEETIFDEASGLILRIFPSGRKNFGWRFADKFRKGALSRVSYGDYPNRTLDEARKIHAEVRSARRNNINVKDPDVLNKLIRSIIQSQGEGKVLPAPTGILFDQLVDRFFSEYIEAEGIGPRPYNRIKNHMLPYFSSLVADAIPDEKIKSFMISKRKENVSEQTLGDSIRFTCMMYEWAIKNFLCKKNPFDKYRLKRSSGAREVYFTMQEIRTLLNNDDNHSISPDYFLLQKALILSGCRRSELTKAEHSEFNFDLSLWTIPPERLKNQQRKKEGQKKPFILPMSVQLRNTLNELSDRFGNQTHIFGSKRAGLFDKETLGTGPACDRTYDTYITAYRRQYGIENKLNHDLRRTLETHLTNLGVNENTTTAMTGHSRTGMKGVYNQAQQTHVLRAGFQLWADFIDFICKHDAAYAIAFDNQAPGKELMEIYQTFNSNQRVIDALSFYSTG